MFEFLRTGLTGQSKPGRCYTLSKKEANKATLSLFRESSKFYLSHPLEQVRPDVQIFIFRFSRHMPLAAEVMLR